MPDKDPTSYSLLTYAWIIMLSSTGGIISYLKKAKSFSIVEFITELLTAAFVGIITFWLCEQAIIDPLTTAALVGISGHMGSRALLMLEKFFKGQFQ